MTESGRRKRVVDGKGIRWRDVVEVDAQSV